MRQIVEESGVKPITFTSYEPSGKRVEVPSFYDKLDGTAAKIEVITAATYQRSQENMNFKKQINALKKKATYANH